ncbi:DUF2487 family protein [Paenibacillus brevis]|uniref:YpiF family protein n=1 Tax=Paenibacillus brevis TaxID=2841508 RepID=A0ABS6FUG4_9BACL|nr:DUF2487 family protein [Paenibacillus brevis]MBU5672795.1 YpiF family protein [Paenibacillus brevis]
MKFSEFEAKTWDEMKEFFDTCLLPVTGLTGSEAPHEAAERLELLRDVMDWIESPFQGRVVTYPAIQYGGAEVADQINKIIQGVRQAGFTYVIVASTLEELNKELLPEVNLIVTPQRYAESAGQHQSQNPAVKEQILSLWQEGK